MLCMRSHKNYTLIAQKSLIRIIRCPHELTMTGKKRLNPKFLVFSPFVYSLYYFKFLRTHNKLLKVIDILKSF
jgi:hypothetical protein